MLLCQYIIYIIVVVILYASSLLLRRCIFSKCKQFHYYRERAGAESTVEAFLEWKSLEADRISCREMLEDSDPEIKEMARGRGKDSCNAITRHYTFLKCPNPLPLCITITRNLSRL